MLPHFHFLGIPLSSYTAMVILGMAAYVTYLKLIAFKREGIDRISENRLLFVSILGFLALFGSAFVFNSLFHSIEEGKLVIGGITWLGGVIGLIPAVYWLIHVFVPKDKGNEINRFSTMMPGLVLAHGFGRIGCFLAGCCYGARTDSFLGVSFPAGSAAGKQFPDVSATDTLTKELINEAGETYFETFYPSLPVIPTQLLEALFAFALFAVMIIFYKKFKHINVEIYCFSYGTFRFILEFWRGDDRGSTGILLSPSQFMSIILVAIGVTLILMKRGVILKRLSAKCAAWRELAKDAPSGKTLGIFTKSIPDTIRELHKLMEDGIISEEEFEAKKEQLLKKI